ncbi:MAG: type II secretion system protein [Planctomycetes bacterium]|nr:type II secretion system protein [Planctomycetota bacterium]
MKNVNTNKAGFTLIEILIVTALMMIIIGVVTAVFTKSTGATEILEASTNIFKEARYSLDEIQTDLSSLDPFDGAQRFIMENGYYEKSTGEIQVNEGGGELEVHTIRGADRMIFRTSTFVGDIKQHVEVEYFLKPMMEIDGRQKRGLRTKTPLFYLMKKASVQDEKSDELIFNQQPKDSKGKLLRPEESVCENVISFNIEYLASNLLFSQLAPSPCPRGDPLGDEKGKNDTGDTAITIPQIRITLVLTDSIQEINIRPFDRVVTLVVE